ncbi:MAG: MarR family transcriptional regulator [Candidatus Omnitrophota bacterium]|nr:MarR family transcriptional regulator [Candidatus Omnitrophota bacterium]
MSDLTLSDFAEKIEDVMPTVMKGFAKMQTNELFKGKITLPQFFVLSHLDKQRESKMNELAKFMEVTTAAATGIVDRLVRYGYIARVYDPKDRRVINVRLTQKGSDLVKKIGRQRREVTSEVFGKISKEERENYLAIMLHIRDVLMKEQNS